MVQFNLADLFEAVATTVPEREALVCVGGGEPDVRLTYGELDDRATRLGNALVDRDVQAGDHVALYLHNGNEYLEGMLGAFKVRAVPVNVNYRYVEDELRYLLDDSDARVVVHEPEFGPLLGAVRPSLPALNAAIARGSHYEDVLDGTSPAAAPVERSADDLYVLYTGGTTGMPKGVLWRHEDIFFGALGGGNPGGPGIERPEDIVDRARQGGRRTLPASPLMHGSAHWAALSTLFTGGTVVLLRDARLDTSHVWDVVASERVSFLVIVGDAFARPLGDALEAHVGRWELSPLTVVLSGGAILSPVVKERLVSLLPTTMIVDGFGASETGGQGQRVATAGAPSNGHPRFAVNAETAVLDEHLRPLAPGAGEGWLARRGRIPLGYYKDPEKTARTFPVVDGVRWAVPGDRASIEPDGTIVVYGRGSVSINTGGEKVFPEEVESVLKAHPAVFDAVVVGVPDERWGERVATVVRPREGAAPTLDELAEHCRRHLAGYKVPRQLVLVPEVVRSPSGKPDYRWARAAVTAR